MRVNSAAEQTARLTRADGGTPSGGRVDASGTKVERAGTPSEVEGPPPGAERTAGGCPAISPSRADAKRTQSHRPERGTTGNEATPPKRRLRGRAGAVADDPLLL